MTRRHRLAHRLIWPVLALAVATGLGLAVALRPPVPVETAAPSAGLAP